MCRADALGLLLAAVLLAEWLIFDLTVAGVLIPVGLYLILLMDGVFRPGSPWLMPVIKRGDQGLPLVALTFDDGPDSNTTPAILDALQAANAKATFFCIGRHLQAHPDLARRIVLEGHELGNHSFDHSRTLNFARDGAMSTEILKGAKAVQAVTRSEKMPIYRPPVGLKSPPLARIVNRLGLKVVMWSLHARDTGGASAERIASRVLQKIKPGDIVVMHDGHDLAGRTRSEIVEAVGLLLEGLQAKGLQPVTVSQLLRAA